MQRDALANAVVAYASNIDNLGVLGGAIEKIAHRHVALNVTPGLYPMVHDNLMIAIAETLGDAVTPEIAEGWSEAVMFLAGVCINAEEDLAVKLASRQGGWRGEREFELVSKEAQAQDVVTFKFAPTDGYQGGFEYTAGQYLTIRNEGRTPRHYTLTSKSGDDTLQCTTRLLKGGGDHPAGDVTSFMHQEMAIGDKCLMGPPAGVFIPKAGDKPVALISAGIGITPMYAFLNNMGSERVKQALHIEENPNRHAFKSEFEKSGVACQWIYTAETGRPSLADEAVQLCNAVGKDADYYICGPAGFMSAMEAELKVAGASSSSGSSRTTSTLVTTL